MNRFKIFIPIFLSLVLIVSVISPSIATAESINTKIFRLHIIANSNSSEDQNIKLELRDYFLENTKDLFIGKTIDENINIANENISVIENICNEFLAKYNQHATVSVNKEFFPTRVYDDFTLPAGVYNAIKITIGEGSGHNWWCIVFPNVCLSACSTSMNEYLTDEEIDLINSGYTPKFKIIEIYEKIKDKLD